MLKNVLKLEFGHLSNHVNYPAAVDKRRRGREFERLIFNLLELEGLAPKMNFRPEGEEIDGSFLFANKVFLIEAKWHSAPMPASSIYQFKGKVDGKLTGTIGIYISMSGFSSEAVDALTFGKSINIILFDGADFALCVNEEDGFSKVLQRKLRVATEKGTPFFSLNSVEVESKSMGAKKAVAVSKTNRSNFTDLPSKEINDIVIVVEGQGDQEIVAYLAEKILKVSNKQKNVMVRNAGGKYSVARLANAIKDFSETENKYILIADSDFDVEETYNLLYQNLEDKNAVIIIPDPEIEVWFQQSKVYDRNDLRNMAKERKVSTSLVRSYLLERIDVHSLKEKSASFKAFYDAIAD